MICSAFVVICGAFVIICGTFVMICSAFVFICGAFVFLCGGCVIIWSSFYIICGAFFVIIIWGAFVVICGAFFIMRWWFPGVWVGACEKSTRPWAPMSRIRHFVSVLASVVFSWRPRNGHSLKETETRRSDWEISNCTHYSGHCLQVVGTRNGNVKHKFLQWYDVFAYRMHQIWGRSTEETRGNVWCPHFLYSTVCAWWFATRGIYNQGNIFDPCCIGEYGLPEDEAIRIEQVRVHCIRVGNVTLHIGVSWNTIHAVIH